MMDIISFLWNAGTCYFYQSLNKKILSMSETNHYVCRKERWRIKSQKPSQTRKKNDRKNCFFMYCRWNLQIKVSFIFISFHLYTFSIYFSCLFNCIVTHLTFQISWNMIKWLKILNQHIRFGMCLQTLLKSFSIPVFLLLFSLCCAAAAGTRDSRERV